MNLILLIIGAICVGNGVNAATGWGAFFIGLACLGKDQFQITFRQ